MHQFITWLSHDSWSSTPFLIVLHPQPLLIEKTQEKQRQHTNIQQTETIQQQMNKESETAPFLGFHHNESPHFRQEKFMAWL